MITFKKELMQGDEGYESRSESLNIPTPLRRAPLIYHISTSENLSFNHTTPLTTGEQHPVHWSQRFRSHSLVCCHLVFNSSDEENLVRTPHIYSTAIHQTAAQSMEEQYLLLQYSTTWITNTCLHQTQMNPSKMLQQKNIFPQLQ